MPQGTHRIRAVARAGPAGHAAWSQTACPSARRSRRACSRGESARSEEHTSELQSPDHLVCRLLLEKKKTASGQLNLPRSNLFAQLQSPVQSQHKILIRLLLAFANNNRCTVLTFSPSA